MIPFLNANLAASASFLRPIGAAKGDLEDNMAAMVVAASKHP